jgi:hypothetical protein
MSRDVSVLNIIKNLRAGMRADQKNAKENYCTIGMKSKKFIYYRKLHLISSDKYEFK